MAMGKRGVWVVVLLLLVSSVSATEFMVGFDEVILDANGPQTPYDRYANGGFIETAQGPPWFNHVFRQNFGQLFLNFTFPNGPAIHREGLPEGVLLMSAGEVGGCAVNGEPIISVGYRDRFCGIVGNAFVAHSIFRDGPNQIQCWSQPGGRNKDCSRSEFTSLTGVIVPRPRTGPDDHYDVTVLDEALQLGKVTEVAQEIGVDISQRGSVTVGGNHPQVIVWVGALDAEGKPEGFTANAIDFNKQVFACEDFDQDGKCDFIQAQACSGEWFRGACCNGEGTGEFISSGEIEICREHREDGTNRGQGFACAGINEPLLTTFEGSVNENDHFDVTINTNNQKLKNSCQVCRKYAPNENPSTCTDCVQCVDFGEVLPTSFINQVKRGRNLEFQISCDNPDVRTNFEWCLQSADDNEKISKQPWRCGGINEFVVEDWARTTVNDGDRFNMMLRFKESTMKCGEVIELAGGIGACGQTGDGDFIFATHEDVDVLNDFSGCPSPGFVTPIEDNGILGFETCGSGPVVETDPDDHNTCGLQMRSGALCSFEQDGTGLEAFAPLNGDVREVPCAGETFLYRNESNQTEEWLSCSADLWPGPLRVGDHDYLCNLDDNTVAECCQTQGCQGADSEPIFAHESATDGDAVFYCATRDNEQDVFFTQDLDTTSADVSESLRNCAEGQLPDEVDPAGYRWTGSACCSEADDTSAEPVGEYYSDVAANSIGGCWNGTVVRNSLFVAVEAGQDGSYATTVETDMINVDGAFYGCSLEESDVRLAQLDVFTSDPVVQNMPQCTTLRSFSNEQFLCGRHGVWESVTFTDEAIGDNESVRRAVVPGFNLLVNPGFEESK